MPWRLPKISLPVLSYRGSHSLLHPATARSFYSKRRAGPAENPVRRSLRERSVWRNEDRRVTVPDSDPFLMPIQTAETIGASYRTYVNPQWVRLLDVLQMN